MPMKENWVICESFFGKSYSDSPKYIYEYLCKNYPGKYRFIWVVNKRTKIPYGPTKVKRFSIRYSYYMARCKYNIFNVRQPEWFKKRAGNVFLETWHGTPLKKLVFDQEEVMGASPLYKAQFYKQSRVWDYLVSANRFSSEVFKSAFLFDKEMLEYGYPRNDILHSPDKEELAAAIKKKLGIPEGKKTILYAPTWRDDEYYGRGEYKFALKLDLRLLKKELGDGYAVLLRTHYFIADALDVTGLEGFAYNVSKYDDISELYLISDMLITDYSSVFFDYANLKRPILFYTYDLDKYRDMLRGFYMNIETEVPGPLLYTSEEVVEAIRNIDDINEEYKLKYDEFYERFCSLEDGHAAENVAKKVFKL
nr:CDP-glycerol glycerophosphotransferase family protein [Mobilitalea sibirica]